MVASPIFDEQDRVIHSGETRLLVTAAGEEYFRSEMDEKLLRKIADDSNGQFFSAQDTGNLIAALNNNSRSSRQLLRLELWDMPLLFLLLITLLCSEWGYRRWRGLA